MNKITIALAVACSWLAIHSSDAVTIPAGTPLSVRTNETINSNDHVGRTFAAHLDHNVVVGGHVVLRAGTSAVGRVDSSRRLSTTNLVLNVTHLGSHGRLIPIKTTAGFRADDKRFKTRGGISVGAGGFYHLPAGFRMHFRLAQPVDLSHHSESR